MDYESVFLTILAISVGWLFNEMSQFLKYRREDKRLINESLYQLLDLKFRLNQLMDVHIAADEQSLMSDNKRLFNSIINTEDIIALKPEIMQIVIKLSKFDPIVAQKLRVIIEGTEIFSGDYLKLHNKYGDVSDERILETNLKLLDLFSMKIEEFIRNLAFRKSKWLWLRIYMLRFQEKKEYTNNWIKLFEDQNSGR